MEVMRETPPPLPPKTKKPIQLLVEQEPELKSYPTNGFPTTRNDLNNSNDFETGSLKIVNSWRNDADGSSPPTSFQSSEKKITETQSNKISKTVEVKKIESDFNESKNEAFGPRIITWAGSRKILEEPKSEEYYKNVSCGGFNHQNNCLKNEEISREINKKKEKEKIGRRKTPKIEVRQEDNKTVVKISIKETPTPEEEMSGENRFKIFTENLYENGYQGPNGFAPLDSEVVYANCDKTANEGLIYENSKFQPENEWCYENLSSGCYENVQEESSNERVYENVNEPVGYGRRVFKKELTTEANYGNLNGEDPECDQVYKNREFQIAKKNVVSIISKNLTPPAKNLPERQDKDDELYENVKIDCHTYVNENLHQNEQKNVEKSNETAENFESRKKDIADAERKSSVEMFLQKQGAVTKVEKVETDFGDNGHLDDSSSGDTFDSGTCSDVDSIPAFLQSKKGNVIVTIKTLQNDEKAEDLKKSEVVHRRAESLTSSGVGVDSEESDDEKSNISCDSLNSNEPYAQSNSEDHGYHTPNSEDKTGSPIDQIEYENVMKGTSLDTKTEHTKMIDHFSRDYYDKKDIIQQVADASQKIKNLRLENNGVYLAKLMDPSDFEEYENIRMFDASPKLYKKKPAPPPPSKPLVSLQQFCEEIDEEFKKSLPTSLLQDIRSRNVRLSSTYPNGEKPESVKNSVSTAVLNLQGRLSGKPSAIKLQKASLRDPKRLMVEERTYEERKSEVRSVKVNKICAMEVDTDKFYKFHLAENVRENVKNGENEDETFAGLKDYLSREKPAAITSAKGTIRGVKNRVKAGIATFLQFHENKSYKDRDAGKVVVYTTTMGIVRETYHKCLKVKQILRTLMVKFEERDVFMSSEAQEEIRDRMKCDVILVPQVFVEGQHIGDAETIERLNEMGELRTILKPYKSADACSTCKVCGGYRLLPCSICKGSKKSIHRNHFTAEFVALKCMNCDQVGLTKCHAC